MAKIQVRFVFYTGVKKAFARKVELLVTVAADFAPLKRSLPMTTMQEKIGKDGCPRFEAVIGFDESQIGCEFRWGVVIDDVWGIPTEKNDPDSQDRYQSFTLSTPQELCLQQESFFLTHGRRLGANKRSGSSIRFAVWAPNAKNVEVVFGAAKRGYIADDGRGADTTTRPLPLHQVRDGVWQTATIPDFKSFANKAYMFRITRPDGRVTYRTDLYSRCQIGAGDYDPEGMIYRGKHGDLDGTRSCSLVIDPDLVEGDPEELFWKNEWNDSRSGDRPADGRPALPRNLQDLVIYEMHIGALGFGRPTTGTFDDAIKLLDYLSELGINAIEVLPIAEYQGAAAWGYGTSHYFAIESSAGGRDRFKLFVRECHRRGIAVIMDVVFNHYHHSSERAEWMYDSGTHEENIYYWYEGQPSDYPDYEEAAVADPERTPPGHGGYIDNLSTGYAPRFHEEMVRKMFISSAVTFLDEFHVDGFRLDQTTSIHLYNVLHADGRPATTVNAFGAKFLREFSRTLTMVNPDVLLIAEDHSDWDKVTQSPDDGGLGFDAVWHSSFYHNLVGCIARGPEYGCLITKAGLDASAPLGMDAFARALAYSGSGKVVYHSSHDEIGNAEHSARPMVLAVNHAPLIGETRRYAEARCRFAFGMSMLSAGTPMFFMGEEIGAAKAYTYDTFLANKEDLLGEKEQEGKRVFAFYRDLIQFRLRHPAIRSLNIEILYVHNVNRVIVFRRWNNDEELLVWASLNNLPFGDGYVINHPSLSDGSWREVFNADHKAFGGNGIQNYRERIIAKNGKMDVVIPANGFVILQKW